jgi:tartrate dehydrogenase/decarboxylase/D-malate dehydrogenase
MMMHHLGYRDMHDSLITAIEHVLREGGHLTRDMGGTASTEQLGRAVREAI